jgi:hypothetical protein
VAVGVEAPVTYRGGPLELDVSLTGPPALSVWLAEARMTAFDSMTR